MAEELKLHWSPDEPYIRGSLGHTAGLIDGARVLLEKNLPHLAYHLALLALEEIGKLEVVLVGRVGDADDEASFRRKFLDDHVGKIFWAFWGPTFSRQLIDQRQIDWHQNFAKQLHEKRLKGLYTEPYDEEFIAPSDQVTAGDAKALIDMAEMRLTMQRDREPAELTEGEKADLIWFRTAGYDTQTKEFIVSGASMKKLAELKDLRAWVKWLHDTVTERDIKLMALGEAEIKRELMDGDLNRMKWKFRIRLKTNSHIIKPKAISAWNRLSSPIKWTFVDKKTKDEIIVEFELPKSVLAGDLYDIGLQFAYRFVIALNIGSPGFLLVRHSSTDTELRGINRGCRNGCPNAGRSGTSGSR
jgi:AbiV family abortive infection protein